MTTLADGTRINRRNRYHVDVVSLDSAGGEFVETSWHSNRAEALRYAKGATSRGFARVAVRDMLCWQGSPVLFTWTRPVA